ncbi:MAG: glycosyltransferase family 2 protein [Alphaproteobacteria bacterium]
MLFSIITVTRNNAAGLIKTRDSILGQSCTDFEWLIQDGASTDDSLRTLKNTPAIIESAPDTGIYNAMNRAIERSKGKYLLFLNAGDTLVAPDTLKTIKTATKPAPDFIYGDAFEGTHQKPAKPHTSIKYGMFTHHQSMLYTRNKIANLRYNESYKIASDYDFTARFLQQNKNTTYIPKPLCIFEPGGTSQINAALGRHEQFLIRKSLNLCPHWQNHAITAAQSLNLALRRHAPALYWLLKRHGS